MRNLVLFFSALILGTSGVMATGTTDDKVAERNAYRYNDSFIFVENGITFSIYPDGEFDFYIDNRVSGRRNGVTFNSGFDYSPYAQYDDYGAVIQVENVPIFYDHYGRVTQVGDVDITYNNGRVRRLGGMNVYYNRSGFYDYHTGYINVFNRHYVYRPFHGFFARPSLGLCLVFGRPYRRFYSPIRYTYYNPYRYNTRRAYAKVGRTHRYNQVRRERSKIYRNDERVAVRNNAVRSNRSVAKRGNNTVRNNRAVAKRSNATRSDRGRTATRNSAIRSNSSNRKIAANRTAVDRTRQIRKSSYKRGDARPSNGRTVTKRSTAVRAPKRNSTVKRTVTRTPQSRTVTRTTKTYKPSQSRTTNRSVRQAPAKSRGTATRSSSTRRSVSKAPSRSRSSVATRSSSRKTVSKAPARSSRNTTSRSSSRSSRRY